MRRWRTAAALGLTAVSGCRQPVPMTPRPSESAPAAAPVRLAAGTAKYRTASHLAVEQRLGEQVQTTRESLVAFVTATLEPAGERLRVRFGVDSAWRAAEGSLDAEPTRTAGATFSGTLEPDGKIAGLSGGDSTNHFLEQLRETLAQFYPRIPAGGLAPGTQWTDTTETVSRASGFPLTIRAVTEHRCDSAAARGLDLRSRTHYTFSGSGAQGGQAFSVAGEGRRQMLERVSADGRFLGMIAADTSQFTISLPALELTIPGRQIRADTVAMLPR